jgi:hypothetical protein
MKSQIELTNNHIKKYNENIEKKYKREYEEDWQMRKYWNKNKTSYHYCLSNDCIKPKYVLIIKNFNSFTTSKEQLLKIFNQSDIDIVFIDDLFNNFSEIKQETIMNQQDPREKNNLLTETLLQAEKKIKQLEEEILLLKNEKKTKCITDFYKKK